MWHNMADDVEEKLLEQHSFPAVCPACGRREAHAYIVKYTEVRGGCWVWCSHCRAFSHHSLRPPSYWGAQKEPVDRSCLSALPADLEKQKDAVDAWMTLHYRGLDHDLCECCIRNLDLSNTVCPDCHGKHAQAHLDGPCLILRCPDCGFEVIGGSFYAPCEQDNGRYRIRIISQKLSKEQILAVGRCLKLPVLEVKKCLDEGRILPKELYLGPAMSAQEYLEQKGILCRLSPKPRYGRYRACGLKMEIHRL